MADGTEHRLETVAQDFAGQAQRYLNTVSQVASGQEPGVGLSLLLLAVSQILTDGARLGAMADIVPAERFEPDNGVDEDFGPMLVSLAAQLEGLDEYVDLVDPVTSAELTAGNLPGDLITIAEALARGLQHYRGGAPDEALWWWQFSFLSDWGERAATASRVLISVLSHLRLDADPDLVADAQFHALHP